MKRLPEPIGVLLPLCLLMKIPKSIRLLVAKPVHSRCRRGKSLAKNVTDADSAGSISLEIMTALFVISLTFAAFIHVTNHLKHQGYLLRIRGEGMTALASQYEMAALGRSFLPSLPKTLRVCQQDSETYQRLWLAIALVGQQADCNISDPMSLVLRKPSS